jgi:type II secretion system protein J
MGFLLSFIIKERAYRLKGFTLFEMLVAMIVFSVLMLAIFKGFGVFSRINDESENKQLIESQVIKFKRLFLQDFINIKRRPHTNALGQLLPSLLIDNGEEISFIRGGLPLWDNVYPGGMQLLSYHKEGGNLVRTSWNALDIAPGEKGNQKIILSSVKSFSIRLLNKDQSSSTFWPRGESWRKEGIVISKDWMDLPALVELSLVMTTGQRVILRFPGFG